MHIVVWWTRQHYPHYVCTVGSCRHMANLSCGGPANHHGQLSCTFAMGPCDVMRSLPPYTGLLCAAGLCVGPMPGRVGTRHGQNMMRACAHAYKHTHSIQPSHPPWHKSSDNQATQAPAVGPHAPAHEKHTAHPQPWPPGGAQPTFANPLCGDTTNHPGQPTRHVGMGPIDVMRSKYLMSEY